MKKEEKTAVLLVEGFFFTREQATILINALEVYSLEACTHEEWKIIEDSYKELEKFRNSPYPEGYDSSTQSIKKEEM